MANKVVEFIIRMKDEASARIKSLSGNVEKTKTTVSDFNQKLSETAAPTDKSTIKIQGLGKEVKGLSSILGQAGGALRGFAGGMGVIGMAVAAFKVGMTLGNKFMDGMGWSAKAKEEKLAKLQEQAEKTKSFLEKFESEEKERIDEITESYNKQIKEIDHLTSKTEALAVARQKAAKAERERLAIQTDINENAAISQGWDKDAVKLMYTDERRRQQAEAGIEDAQADSASAQRGIDSAKQKADALWLNLIDLKEQVSKAEAEKRKIAKDFNSGPDIDKIIKINGQQWADRLIGQGEDPFEVWRKGLSVKFQKANRAVEIAERAVAAAQERYALAEDSVAVAEAEADAAKKSVEVAKLSRERVESQYQSDLTEYWEKRDEDDRKHHEEEMEAIRKQIEERRRLQEQADAEAHKRRVAGVKAEAQEWAQAQRRAEDRLSKARDASARAWAFYRDPEAFARQREEERADAEARKRFVKDEDRLKRLTNWRTRELNDEQEAVRRVVFAREEEAAAQAALTEIARNTSETNKMLEQLLTLRND